MHMYEESTHLRWLVVQVLGFMATYCLLPLIVPLHVCCELLCCACASACARACAGASACAVQVQLQVMCGVRACTRCRFFHVSIATSGKVIFCATVIVYIVRSLYHWFFESYELRSVFFFFFFSLYFSFFYVFFSFFFFSLFFPFFLFFFFTFPYWDFGSDSK